MKFSKIKALWSTQGFFYVQFFSYIFDFPSAILSEANKVKKSAASLPDKSGPAMRD
jgi:hypothetical protein